MQRAEETIIGPVDTPPFDSNMDKGSGEDSSSLSYFAKLADEE